MLYRIWALTALVALAACSREVPQITTLPPTTLVAEVSLDPGRYSFRNSGRLTVAEGADLGLHPERLKEAKVMLNYITKLRRSAVDTLAVGTLVWADSTGNPIYKEDCGNRLFELAVAVQCPACLGVTDAVNTVSSRSFWGELSPWWILLWLILLTAGLILLALYVMGWRRRMESGENRLGDEEARGRRRDERLTGLDGRLTGLEGRAMIRRRDRRVHPDQRVSPRDRRNGERRIGGQDRRRSDNH